MNTSESLKEFYERVFIKETHYRDKTRNGEHFNVYRRNDVSCKQHSPYNRRDFYKISLILGSGTLYYADKGISIPGKALLFSNPNIPYAWEASSPNQSGYFCLFSEGFTGTERMSESLENSPLFKVGGNPLYFINEWQKERISSLFENIIKEVDSGYKYKYDLIRNYLYLIMHEALKMQPADTYFKHTNASSRVASLFLDLLERQFPVSFERNLRLKTASDYALHLSIHTNHLNKAVKEITGKTTTEHIASKMLLEAKTLLKHTNWNITEIAYCLGFENPTYFNNFFKKHTSATPSTFREELLS
ncbi:AraC family transcriptional regulator [Rapidithrix thailandica]|uniref:AraC family transcriptional regulator n=1 Tax=Rapidithrix thailandica TaxID=413964 RepID=A0AAW9S2D0_9BACT